MADDGSTVTTTPDRDETGQDSEACPVCPHPWADHDVIGRRFCSARIAGGSSTGCVCARIG